MQLDYEELRAEFTKHADEETTNQALGALDRAALVVFQRAVATKPIELTRGQKAAQTRAKNKAGKAPTSTTNSSSADPQWD